MKTFTRLEWKDLARGCRILAANDAAYLEKNGHTTIAAQFEEIQKRHLEMAQRCEDNSKLAKD